jgi:hypothetical protein
VGVKAADDPFEVVAIESVEVPLDELLFVSTPATEVATELPPKRLPHDRCGTTVAARCPTLRLLVLLDPARS